MLSQQPIRAFLRVALLFILFPAAYGQYAPEPERWHLTGFAGFDLSHTSQNINDVTDSGQLFPLGDLRLNTDGFLLDPRFLHLDGGLDYQKGVNSSQIGNFNLGGLNFSVSGVFLPTGHVPLRGSYTRTDHGVSGLGLNQNDDDSRLDVEWNASFPSLPHLSVGFQKYDTTVHVPTSFSDRSYSQMGLSLGASDVWKKWQWMGNFADSSSNSTGVFGLGLTTSFDDSSRTGSFDVSRAFWDNKARLRFENRELWRHDNLGDSDLSDNSELTNAANFDVQLNSKWSLDTGYSFSHVDFQGTNLNNLAPGVGQTQLIALNSSTTNSFSGRVSYRPTEWLRLTQEARTIRTTPATGVLDSRTSLTDTLSTIGAERHWRGFDVAGSYTGRYQLTGTTLEESASAWSNSFMARVSWGDVRRVHVSAIAQDNRLNLVEQIGGFSQDKRYGIEAESTRLKVFRLRASLDRSQFELLNISGNTRSDITTLSVQAEHRLLTVSYMRSLADGAGAIFPPGLFDNQILIIPLPIGQLVGTPLLDRTTHTQSISLFAHPRRRLDVFFIWRQEDTQLTASDQTFSTLQADARYHLGRMTLEGGYSRNLNDVTNITGLLGNRLARWYLRVGRDFRFF